MLFSSTFVCEMLLSVWRAVDSNVFILEFSETYCLCLQRPTCFTDSLDLKHLVLFWQLKDACSCLSVALLFLYF